MSHPKWFLIDNNCPGFDEKMLNTKMAVHSVLSAPIGEHFDAKYLIKHEKDLAELVEANEAPIDKSKFPTHEQVDIIMDFIIMKDREGKKTLGSIEKRGNEISGYCYIQNLQFKKLVAGEEHIIKKKRNILPSEYFALLDSRDPNCKQLLITRYVMIDYQYYFTLDHYRNVDGQPLILIVRKTQHKQEKDAKNALHLKFPLPMEYLRIIKDVSNQPEYD